jgi:PAS domain S-box-containing protein
MTSPQKSPTSKAVESTSEMGALYHEAFMVSPEAITVTDLASGIYLDVNKSFEELVGIAKQDLIGRRAASLGIWVDPNERAKLVECIAREGKVNDFLAVGRFKDGKLRTCSINGTVLNSPDGKRLVLVVRDISEQLLTERHLRETAEKFSKAFHASPEALVLCELNTTRVLEANEAFFTLTARTREEALGRCLEELGVLTEEGALERFISALRLEGRQRNQESWITTKGVQRIILLSGELLEHNGAPHIMLTARDITQQREAEQEKRLLESQLRQTQKLEELGTLAGGIAHDFNNILTAIMAYTDLAALDIEDRNEVLHHLTEVKKASTRAQELVSRILTFSRRQRQDRRSVDIQVTMREALGLLRSTLPARISIVEQFLDSPQPVLADPGQVIQVLMNLGTNAAHAIGQSPGTITVRVEAAAPEVLPPGLPTVPYLRISVSDTGCGISPQVMQRMFEPFFTTKPQGEGSGLGLAVVHGIVKSHDGAITVDSNPGKGTRFNIFLPLHRESAASTGSSESPPTGASVPPTGQGERILFIDDEPQICEFALQLLTRLGYQVSTCSNPAEALAFFTDGRREFDLVFTDLSMPRMAGTELAARLLARDPELTIILATGYTGAWTREKLRELGIFDLLNKPLSLQALAEAAQRGVQNAATRRQRPGA